MPKAKNLDTTEYHVWLWNDNMDWLDELASRRWNGHTERSKVLNAILAEHRRQLQAEKQR